MKQNEFFEKLENKGFKGESLGFTEDVIDYIKNPKENKVYNLWSKESAKDLVDIVNKNTLNLSAKFIEIEPGRKYQVGIFYKKKKE
jgi:hypothetical protein